MEQASRKRFPVNPEDYKLYEEVGEGVSATVYRALCIPFNEIVAIKVLDLEKCNNNLDGIRREVQTMLLIDHPNVLRAFCSFTTDQSLWVVMPYMAGGSCLHIMKSAHPEGFEEPVIATLLREVLKAIAYLHRQGHIHRDVKAGNILVDVQGAVKLADFGVSACMFDTGDRQQLRNTFVGTPCWMAPEVMRQLHGYDFKADIWSFGITALELAHGHAPFSKYPPMKVLLMTLQNAPPGLDYERDKKFSKSFKDLVATCLVKDPKKRPTSEKLLKHSFFKRGRSNEYFAKNLLDDLSPLGDRFRKIKAKEADILRENKEMYEEHLSQQKYIKGISGWDFNVEDLKRQAALLDDTVGVSTTEELGATINGFNNGNSSPDIVPSLTDNPNSMDTREGEFNEVETFEDSFASSFSSQPLDALKGYFDVCKEDDASTSSPDWNDATNSYSAHVAAQKQSLLREDSDTGSSGSVSVLKDNVIPRQPKFFIGSLITEHVNTSAKSVSDDTSRAIDQPRRQSEWNYSGPSTHEMRDPQHEPFVNPPEEVLEGRVVRRKGRFKITSEDASSKGHPSCSTNPPSGTSNNATTYAYSVIPSLQFLVQQNAIQKEQLSKLVRYLEHTSCRQTESVNLGTAEPLQVQHPSASNREKELISYAVQLQQSINNLVEEVQRLKVQNAQLQQQLDTLSSKGEGRVPHNKGPWP